MINDRLDTLARLQPPTTTKQYELRIRGGHHTTLPNQWKSDRLKSELDLENESDLGEGEPAYRDTGKT